MTEQTSSGADDPKPIWTQATEGVKQRLVMPALWRAMERGTPVLIHENELVIGYPVEQSTDSHLVQDTRYKNVIEQCIAAAASRPLSLRVISGTTLDDWQQLQEIQREAARLRAAGRAGAAALPTDESWDGVWDQLARHYNTLSSRQSPALQGEFLDHCVAELAKAYSKLMGNAESPPEAELRNYGRVLDRIADRTAVASALIAYLVCVRRRQQGE
jgi:hypothetical protein